MKKDKKRNKKKKALDFGFFTQPSKFFHTLYFQYKELLSIKLPEIKTRLSYMTLVIDVAR